MSTSTRSLASAVILSATVCSPSFAQATWEFIARQSTDVNVAGVTGVVWLPNSFSNPALDSDGRVTFSAKIQNEAGTLTNANQGVMMRGTSPASLVLLGRNGSPVLAGGPAGAVFNSSTGINGLASGLSTTPNGYTMVSGTMNGGGVTTSNNTATWLVNGSGTASLVGRNGDPATGLPAGVVFSNTFAQSAGVRINSSGKLFGVFTVTGGDTVTTGTGANNQAAYQFGPAGAELVFRKGSQAPGLSSGILLGAMDTFGVNTNGENLQFGGTLVVGTGTPAVTTNDDKVLLVRRNGVLSVIAREGDPAFGLPGDTFKSASTFSGLNRPLDSSGRMIFTASIAGPDVVGTTNDLGLFMYDPTGTSKCILRKGDPAPGSAGDVIGGFSTTTSQINNNGKVLISTILNTAAPQSSATYLYDIASGALSLILKGGSQAPGCPAGALFQAIYTSSYSVALNNSDQVVFSTLNLAAGAGDVVAGVNDVTMYSWSASTGLSLILRKGDTSVTGYAIQSFYPMGSTGQNGNGGSTYFSDNGWMCTNASDSNPNTPTSVDYMILRTKLFAATPCPADLNGDGVVNGADLGVMLAAWGVCPAPCASDLNHDGVVDGADLGVLLAAWGPCL